MENDNVKPLYLKYDDKMVEEYDIEGFRRLVFTDRFSKPKRHQFNFIKVNKDEAHNTTKQVYLSDLEKMESTLGNNPKSIFIDIVFANGKLEDYVYWGKLKTFFLIQFLRIQILLQES